ncbi:PREDICTED: ovomucoid-like [Gekko japonicus]|uniref:Ovomucoid-like n=1 Tax=Gekko japonicus TaxID=146911 RepID=A0ABM1JVX0_GEKJA|nr:PREDICTED: ovomucoid-like [Gekko japonicus]
MGVFVLAVALLCVSGVFSQLEVPKGEPEKNSGNVRDLIPLDCSQIPTSMERPEKLECPSIPHPVCGTDDQEYVNECMICQHNVDHKTNVGRKHDGPCKKENKNANSGNVRDLIPLDCSQIPTSMERPEKLECPSIPHPVCGTDDQEYVNECMICQHNVDHKTNVGRKHDGPCMKENKDAISLLPVESEEHLLNRLKPITVMKAGGFLLLSLTLFFFYTGTTIEATWLDCTGYPRRACTYDYRPLCGTDGITYSNQCLFCNAYVWQRGRLSLRHMGAC